MRLEGKAVLITGAASGIGRAVAKLFAAEGARVLVADINDSGGNETVQIIRGSGGEAQFTHVDVTRINEIQKMVVTAAATWGKLDIFYHNAGIAGPGNLDLTTEEAYDRTMAIHLKAGLFGAKYAAQEIKKAGGGCILFTSSGLGLRPSPSPVYSIAKAGLIMLTRSLAVALASDNIRVNAICPGPVDTALMHQIVGSWNPSTDPEADARNIAEQRLIKRLGTVEEMAAAALFLVSPEASYITGVALPVDGGGVAM